METTLTVFESRRVGSHDCVVFFSRNTSPVVTRQTTATSTKRNQCGPQSSGRLMNAGQRRASHRGEVGALAVLGPGPVGIEDR